MLNYVAYLFRPVSGKEDELKRGSVYLCVAVTLISALSPVYAAQQAGDQSAFIDNLDPTKHVSQEKYLEFWQVLFSTVLQGVWAKVLASAALFLAFWFGVRKQQFMMGIVFFFISILFAYGGTILKFVGLL